MQGGITHLLNAVAPFVRQGSERALGCVSGTIRIVNGRLAYSMAGHYAHSFGGTGLNQLRSLERIVRTVYESTGSFLTT